MRNTLEIAESIAKISRRSMNLIEVYQTFVIDLLNLIDRESVNGMVPVKSILNLINKVTDDAQEVIRSE